MSDGRQYTAREVVTQGWRWTPPFSNDGIRTAALVDIAESLWLIKCQLDSLGYDGVHEVIRRMRTKLRKPRKKRAKK